MRGWGFEATPRQRLLLRAAVLEGPTATAAWERWRREADLDRPEGLDRGSGRLLPLLHANLTAAGVPAVPALKAAHRASWFRTTALLAWARPVLAALSDAGVETMVIKGLPLALEVYPDLASRPMGDLDLVVPVWAGPLACQVLADNGWRWAASELGRTYRELTLVDARGNALDLHWQITERRRARRWEDGCWDRRLPLSVAGVATSRLDPTDELLLAMVHGQASNPEPPIRWLADAALLVRGSEIDWDRLADSAIVAGEVLPARQGIDRLARILDVEVPAEVHRTLRRAPVAPRDRFAWAYAHLPQERRLPSLLDYVEDTGAYRRTAHPFGYARFVLDLWGVRGIGGTLRALAARLRGRRAAS